MRQQRPATSLRRVGQRRSPSDRERQRTEAVQLYLEGRTVQQIALKLGVHRNVVLRDVSVARSMFVREQRMRRVERIAQELAKIDHLERTYWDAWRRSMEQNSRSVTSREDVPLDLATGANSERTHASGDLAPAAPAMLVKRRVQRRVDDGTGNPAYLAGIQWCVDRRAKLLGLDEPVKIDVRAHVQRIAADMGLDASEVEKVAADVHGRWISGAAEPESDPMNFDVAHIAGGTSLPI